MRAERGSSGLPGIVMAGGKAKPELVAVTGEKCRALVLVNGKTLLAHVVDALRAADADSPITVIGDLPDDSEYTRLPDAGGFVENLFAGVNAHADAPYVLISTADLPFLTGASIADFVREATAHAEATGAQIVYPIVPVAECYARFPGMKRTSLRLGEGEFTGGNLLLARPGFLLAQRQRIADAYGARKSPLRLAQMLGFGTLARLILSQQIAPKLLTVSYLEAQVSRLLGGTARALVSHHPEIATDLDRPSDFVALQQLQGVATP